MNATLTVVKTDDRPEQSQPQPIRIIRNGQWAELLPSQLTDDEARAIYVAAFQIYEGGW